MRTESHLAVGSPTARLAAIVLATLLLAAGIIGASFAGAQLLAADGPIVVDANGDGHYNTIQEGVAAADDGDEILVKPGTYTGPVDITANITLRGEDRDEVIIQFGGDCEPIGPDGDQYTCDDDSSLYEEFWYDPWPYGILLRDSDAVVSDLTVVKPPDVGGSGLVVNGGAPTVSRITYRGEGDFGNVYVHGDSRAVLSELELGPMWVFFEDGSPATIEDSSTEGQIRLHTVQVGFDEFPTDLEPQIARRNRVAGIVAQGPAEIIGNTLAYDPVRAEDEPETAIDATGSGPLTIEGNHVTGYETAMYGYGRTEMVVLRGNTLVDNGTAISGWSGPDVTIEANTVTGGDTGITASGTGPVADNVIEGVSGRGLAIGASAEVIVSGNRACGNGEDLWVASRAEAEIDDTNEFCVVASPE